MKGEPLAGGRVAPFDSAATGYDVDFSNRMLGWLLRRQVWDQLEQLILEGDRILDLGCGTGEDACWLAARGAHVTAADQSAAMLAVARRKAELRGSEDRIAFLALDAGLGIPFGAGQSAHGIRQSDRSDPSDPTDRPHSHTPTLPHPTPPPFRGVLANFGMVNCLADRLPLAKALGTLVSPGGWVALVVMSPVCPWEIGWYLGHGDPARAFRRFRLGAPAQVGTSAVRVWYPSPAQIVEEFAPWFRERRTAGIGILLPPSYLAHLVDRAPGLFGLFDQVDRLVAEWPGRWVNDHALILLERR